MWARIVEGVRNRIRPRTLASLGLGQVLSLLVTCTGVTSAYLAARGVNMPTTQSLINYALLLVYVVPWWWREGWTSVRSTLQRKWWQYLLLAGLDVEANFLAVLAYQYTSLSSAMLLDCISIPCVMVLGHFVLKVHRFRWPQFVGVGACIAGIVALVLSDWLQDAWHGTHNVNNVLLGDGLVLLAGVLYACCNTGQEMQVVQSKLEYLALLGLFGLPISLLQSAILDHDVWLQTVWSLPTIGLMAAFAASLFLMYSLVPLMLVLAGATFLNLSLLTSDVFAILIGMLLFNYVPSLFYILSAVLIVAGLVVYNLGSAPPSEESQALQSVATMDEEAKAGDSVDVQ